jgi:hypothetical protein
MLLTRNGAGAETVRKWRKRGAGEWHLAKLQTADGERRERFLYAAIDRRSRSAHLVVEDDDTERSAIAFLREAVRRLRRPATGRRAAQGAARRPR